MRHRCSTTGESFDNVVATAKGSVKRKTLKNLSTYVLKKPIDSVTDADILAAVEARCRTLKNEFVPDVTSLFRQKLRMDLSVDDCDARVFRYYEDFNAIIEDNGLQGLIGSDNMSDLGYKSRMKARCRLLVDNLQPPVLKAQITRLIDLEKRECKTDDVALFELILEHAKVQQRFHRLSQDYAAKEFGSKVGKDRVVKNAPKVPTAVTPTSGSGTQSRSASAGQSARVARPPRPPPSDGCLVCKGPHWLADCPTATNAQQEEARQKYRTAKEQRFNAVRSKSARYAATIRSVKINGLLEIPYSPDTGSDTSMVPREVVESLRAMQPSLSVAALPMPVEAVMADGRVQVCEERVLLDLELTTLAGLVSLRSVTCLILAGDGAEFLLGRDVLKGLGIDVDQQLAQLAGPALLTNEMDEFPVGDDLPSNQISADQEEPTALDELLERAVTNGLPTVHVDAVRELLEEYSDVWRVTIGPDAPAGVEPLRVTLRPDVTPYRSPPRKYAPLQAQFIREYVKSLVENGLVEQNNGSRWASAVVPVRKPGTQDKFRLTIDYRPVNGVTIPIAGAIPTVATTVDAFNGKKIYGRFDFTQGFWQLPLHESCQEVFSFVTPDGVFTPNRVPQGAMDSALHFQSQVQARLAPLIPHSALVWVDDVILFAPTVEEFLVTLRRFFELVSSANFKLNMTKCSLFELEVLWCGRLISSAGVRHDPARVSALVELPLPATVSELQYFMYATNWLHDSLPNYTRMIAPLHDKLNSERRRLGRRSKNALNVPTVWNAADTAAYEAVVALVRDSALMTFPDPNARLLLFTDASANGYSIVVTQVRHWDDTLPVDEQNHEMIVCKGGMFKHSELNWTVVEKETYPIVKACHDLLLRRNGFRLYCDHANLAYIFAPSVELKKHVRDRLQRWAMRLCGLNYVIEHIPGEKNVWADIISRWHVRDVVNVAAVRTRSHQVTPVEHLSPLRPMADDNFVFPTLDVIRDAQQAAGRERSRLQVALSEANGIALVDERPWIPSGAKELLARLFIVAHAGSHGHRGQEPMTIILQQRFWIHQLADKVAKFVRECLLCKHFKGPRLIPRPYGPTLTATKRNEAVHWDFLFLGSGYGDVAYLLVVKDELTHYCELFPCATPTSYVAAEELSLWCARYGIPESLISDQGTHFKNETVKHLCARLKVEQNFTPVYSPWLNGTVERLNKDVLQVIRALLMEYSINQYEWPYLLPVLQMNLKHTPVESLAGHAPVELFTGLPASSPLDVVVGRTTDADDLLRIDLSQVDASLNKMRSSLQEMHKEVTDVKERRRLQDIARHKGSTVNFDVGDFVLWSRIDQRLPNNKLLRQWVGPFKVVDTKPYSFMIKHVVTEREYDVHASRLKFYADSELNETAELMEFVSSQGLLFGVESIRDHQFNSALNRWELLVVWAGLQAIENSWEPLESLLQDVPAKVKDYVASSDDEELQAQLE